MTYSRKAGYERNEAARYSNKWYEGWQGDRIALA